jgi:hypothetical protein
MNARVVIGALLVGLLLYARPAAAQRVLLVEPQQADKTLSEAFNRLRAELLLQSFEVDVLRESDAISPATLEEEARRAEAFAAIWLTRSRRGATADVWIADRVTGKISQRTLAIPSSSQAPQLLAVRAADLLRASLRELSEGERPPPDIVGAQVEPPPARVQAWSRPQPKFRLHVGATALGLASDLGAGFGGSIGLSYRPAARLFVGVVLAGPLVGARYVASDGTAVVRQELGLASLTANLLPESRFELGPSLAAGLYHLQAHGEVRTPLRSRSEGVFSFAASGGLSAALRLGPALLLSGSVAALLLTPRPVVAVEEQQTPVGAPVSVASLGLGAAF